MAEMKASYNEKRICLGKNLPLDTPLAILLDVSERCNFRCNYCFRSTEKDWSWGYAAKNNLMGMEIFQQAVGQLSAFPQRIRSIALSGHGEPLCNPELVSMVKYLKSSGAVERIEMHTNASLLTRESARDIAQAGFSRIVVSLQGLDADTYRRVCGAKIDWDEFYSNLRILYENKDPDLWVHIKISEAALNKACYAAEKDCFCSLFGGIADSIFVEEVTPLWKSLRMEASGSVNKYGQDTGEVECCPILFYKMWVAPDGEIYPCTGLPVPMSLGNIKETTLYDAWNGQRRRDFLVDHLRLTRKSNVTCADCFVPVNTVTMEKDRIDSYRSEILKRLGERGNILK